MLTQSKEVERKFLVKTLPELKGLKPKWYERYYLYVSDAIEVRVQKKNDKYFWERKVKTNLLTRENQVIEITEGEFARFKNYADVRIVRQSFQINEALSIKIYHEDFEGLIRAEVEFDDEDVAQVYVLEKWMGLEITNTVLGKDSSLIKLKRDEFLELIG